VLRAVLDANVYVSAAIRPEGPPGRIIERFLRDATLQIVLSSAIADEVVGALGYPKVRKAIRGPIEPELWFEDLVLLADLVSDTGRAAGVCVDPDDDKYISAALEGRAAFVVTGDRQLLALRQHERIRIVDPRAFLDILES
jgi:putative PIN family toxin of toxin-antitoxin system